MSGFYFPAWALMKSLAPGAGNSSKHGGMARFEAGIALPELEKHEKASKKSKAVAGGMRCPCCKNRGREPEEEQEERTEMEL